MARVSEVKFTRMVAIVSEMAGRCCNDLQIAEEINRQGIGPRNDVQVGSIRRNHGIESGVKRMAREVAEQDNKRKVEAYSDHAVRKCLKCEGKFHSEGKGNRICKPCKGNNDFHS